MKKNSIPYRIVIFAVIIVSTSLIFWSFKAKSNLNSRADGLKITKWDNFYDGDNIHFYYLNPQNDNLSKLKVKYGLAKLIDAKGDQFDNSIKIMKFINGKVKAESTAMTSEKNALEIMSDAPSGNKISDSDYVTIYEECLASVGINVRRGVLRSTDDKVKGKSYFNVCEIWSDKYDKWIMIDGVNGYYMTEEDTPLGAVEIINKGLGEVNIAGLKDSSKYTSKDISKDISKYIKNMSSYYESYSISVDNNKYGELKSNSKITFLKQNQLPRIETKEGFIQPTIFVNKPGVFQISPKKEYLNTKKEKKPTLIFAKKDLKNDTKEIDNFTIGAFMNSYMLTKYYVSINGGDYIAVDTFFDLEIVKGINTIKLSQDGKNLDKEVIIEK